LGVYISIVSSWWIAAIGAACMLIGYLYTGGPLPIAYTPLGEICSGILMGTIMIAISYFIQTGHVDANVILLSIPVAIFIATIIPSNNIRDLDNDKEIGRETIAILLGKDNAVIFLAGLFTFAYLYTGLLIFIGVLPIRSVITFLGIFIAIDILKGFVKYSKPIDMMPAMAATGKNNTIYGFLLGISLLIGHFF